MTKFSKLTALAGLCVICVFLIGCSTKEYIYKYPEIPAPLEKPKFNDYNVSSVEINGVNYFVLTERDAEILSQNWIKYKNFSETNYKILKDLNASKK